MNQVSEFQNFNGLNLSTELLNAINAAGYTKPSKIQEKVIPHIMEGRDVIAQAETGSGKTAAFAMPILFSLKKDNKSKTPQVLVLTPTRELAQQVSQSFKKYASFMPWIKTACIYGGQGYRDQIHSLKSNPQIVIGTPGRIIDMMEKGYLKLKQTTKFVLDEADEMLKMGFKEDIELIASEISEDRQTTLFSATMPSGILSISKKYLKDPVHIKLISNNLTNDNVKQKYWMLSSKDKLEALQRLLVTADYDGAIIFVRTKTQAQDLSDKINDLGFSAAPINGDISQSMREKTISRFKDKKFNILVATDVAARGLDIPRIDMVINYDIPHDAESYVHRIGRTGRAGNKGEAILFVTKSELTSLKRIESTIKHKIEKANFPTVNEVYLSKLQKTKAVLENNLEASLKIKQIKAFMDDLVKEGLTLESIASSALYVLSDLKKEANFKDVLVVDDQDMEDDRPQRRGRGGRFNRSSRGDRFSRGAKKDGGRSRRFKRSS